MFELYFIEEKSEDFSGAILLDINKFKFLVCYVQVIK